MKLILALQALGLAAAENIFAAPPPSSKAIPPRGNVGVWIYDHPQSCPEAQFADVIKAFNSEAQAPINHVVLYGSDVELYDGLKCCTPAGDTKKVGRSMTDSMGRRLDQYAAVTDDAVLTFIIDGRMDGTEDWSPDLSRLSAEEVLEWSRWIAQWVCAYERIDGVQLDLEPIGTQYPWDFNFRLLARELGQLFASRDYGCVSPRRPDGVALSTFALATAVDVELMQLLGPNGYVVVSGYDLGEGGAGTPNPPEVYEANLRTNLQSIKATAAESGVPYMVGIPAAASTHEFETFLMNGILIRSGHSQKEYVERALSALQDICHDDPNYLGPMLWTLTYTNVYPPHSNNEMRPQNAYANEDVWATLKTGLGVGSRPPTTQTPSLRPSSGAPTTIPPTRIPTSGAPVTSPPSRLPTSDAPTTSGPSYAEDGCQTDADCIAVGGSYCKTYQADECGRHACQGAASPDPRPGC
jgi:hypothetical protein